MADPAVQEQVRGLLAEALSSLPVVFTRLEDLPHSFDVYESLYLKHRDCGLVDRRVVGSVQLLERFLVDAPASYLYRRCAPVQASDAALEVARG